MLAFGARLPERDETATSTRTRGPLVSSSARTARRLGSSPFAISTACSRSMTVIGIPKFQHFFRASAGLRVDKSDLKRCRDFLNRKLYDVLVTAQATAHANFRDIILPADLPITNGLQLCTHEYQKLD